MKGYNDPEAAMDLLELAGGREGCLTRRNVEYWPIREGGRNPVPGGPSVPEMGPPEGRTRPQTFPSPPYWSWGGEGWKVRELGGDYIPQSGQLCPPCI